MAALYPLIQPWLEGVAPEQLELVRVAEYTFRAKVANRWHRGNMFILGDAAHLTPPFIGQGMGAGLRDATNLTWKLAGVVNGWLPETVLDTYEQERIPHARYMIRFALAMGAAMTAGGEVGNLLRRVVVPRLHLIPGVREKIGDSTTPPLHSSELVVKSSDDGSWRAGYARILFWPNGKRLDEVVGSRFAIITSARSTTSQQDDMARRGTVVVDGASRHGPGPLVAGRSRQGRRSATGSDGAVRQPQPGRSLQRGTGFRVTHRYRR